MDALCSMIRKDRQLQMIWSLSQAISVQEQRAKELASDTLGKTSK